MSGVKSKFMWCCVCCGYRKKKETFDLPTPDTSGSIETKKLVVKGVDLCTEINGEDHHTKRFDLMTREDGQCLVVRRGQAFNLRILLSRPFNFKTDNMSFTLQVKDEDIRTDDTTAKIPLLKDGTEANKRWNAIYKSQTDSYITVSITSPADCIVAAWTIEIKAAEAGVASSVVTHPLPIYILFNPWCENDSVYMSDASHREEYVEEDKGIIFQGSSNNIQWIQWYFAQYEKDILNCAVYLVKNIGMIKGRARGEPIATVRALSAAVNGNDDNGVLLGKWAQNVTEYADGKKPWDWMGSLEILQKYYETKNGVKYAQCWVFAGVLTTICRALGIPSRPVSCFESAHDSDGSLTIDTIIDENGKEIKYDSVWNFHVWNEVWMARPDLGATYGGWQIADSTPQERSDRLFRCGPASLAAVYSGETQLPYDVPFVFAEVNADRVIWKSTGPGRDKQLVSVDTVTVGQNISTKAVSRWDREDLTHRYKSPEGTNRERETLIKALLNSESDYARYIWNKSFTDVKFEFKLPDNTVIGQEFEVEVHMRNQSTRNSHYVTGYLNVITETYRGRSGESVKRQAFDVKLRPEDKTQVTLLVTFDDYYEKLVDQASFKILCAAKIADVDYNYVDQVKLRLRNPDIKMEFDGMKTLNLELENPLPIALNNAKFYVLVTELNKAAEIEFNEDLPSGRKAKATVEFVPQRPGRYHVAAKFSSDELNNVDGYYTLNV